MPKKQLLKYLLALIPIVLLAISTSIYGAGMEKGLLFILLFGAITLTICYFLFTRDRKWASRLFILGLFATAVFSLMPYSENGWEDLNRFAAILFGFHITFLGLIVGLVIDSIVQRKK